MCLATVYKTTKDTEEVVLKNVSKIYVEGSQVRLVDIMGAETVVEGSISHLLCRSDRFRCKTELPGLKAVLIVDRYNGTMKQQYPIQYPDGFTDTYFCGRKFIFDTCVRNGILRNLK